MWGGDGLSPKNRDMVMDIQKFTERAQGFLQAASTIAIREFHQRITPEHLLKALLDDEEGAASSLIKTAGGDPKAVQTANDAASAFEKADAALKKAVKGPVVRDEAAILAALDALDATLLAVSVAARKAAAFDDGSGDTYDLHADAEYAIRRVFDLTN